MIANKLSGPVPKVEAIFPPMDPNSWCREHHPASEAAKSPFEIDFNSLKDLATEGTG
jgi:hypothetical protein